MTSFFTSSFLFLLISPWHHKTSKISFFIIIIIGVTFKKPINIFKFITRIKIKICSKWKKVFPKLKKPLYYKSKTESIFWINYFCVVSVWFVSSLKYFPSFCSHLSFIVLFLMRHEEITMSIFYIENAQINFFYRDSF